ncbi:cyclic nucleotide-binding domain-containing protein [Leptolyngbya sp. NK1-12]|uniref:histidine kinase n=1 Tax=Leptolyngbya sp. NK1-12 TaxID=2547451 RepID=A0AA97AMP4_9CYAN|nr:cyclic nucleotide-binding domain-containing protein [Leptolyngbya sp. NK1-12]
MAIEPTQSNEARAKVELSGTYTSIYSSTNNDAEAGIKIDTQPLPRDLTVERLRQVPIFAKLPEERLNWLLQQGNEVWLEPGQLHRAQGDPADHVFVLLEGEVGITKREGNQDVLLTTYGADTLFGELPVLTGETHFWAAGRAISYCHIFELGVTAFWELLASCPCVTTTILSTMAKRMQAVQSLSQHRQKMVALGTLAAGLAHELNNPASAAQRSTQQLRETSQTLKAATLELHHHLSCAQQAWLAELHQTLMQQATHAVVLDPLTQSDREDEMMDWLHAQGVSDCWRLAPTLVSAGLDVESLTQIASQLPASALQAVLIWLEASLTELRLFDELDHATERIGQMVKAVKDYSYMDQAPLQDIDIHEGLESTLIMLRHKLKQGIEVTRQYDRQLPRITAYGSELNQVWTNLIDNAIDALADFNKQATPTIQIHTRRENETILVEIIDNGPGIPAEIRSQIFAPFFTTKGVGRGTGLGLHIAYRVIVEQHQGDLRVSSEPGNTRFQIRLPIRL